MKASLTFYLGLLGLTAQGFALPTAGGCTFVTHEKPMYWVLTTDRVVFASERT
jgi:hypothetical protein